MDRTPNSPTAVNALWIILLGWLIPGAGHWHLNLRRKAVVFCVCLLTLFAAGMVFSWLGDGWAVDPELHVWLFIAQVCAGPVSLIGWLLGPRIDLGATVLLPRLIDLGIVFTVTAGALNVVVVADAYARAAHLKREADRQQEGRK